MGGLQVKKEKQNRIKQNLSLGIEETVLHNNNNYEQE